MGMIPDIGPGEVVAVALDPETGAAIVRSGAETILLAADDAFDTIARIEREVGPRWVWWSKSTAWQLVEHDIHPARCWDLAAVHRLLYGGWRTNPAMIWAACQGLDTSGIPETTKVDLFTVVDEFDTPDEAVRHDGYLRPDWVEGAWGTDPERLSRWAGLASEVQSWQVSRLAELTNHPRATATARSESAAELLGTELQHDGLPIDIAEAERIIGEFIGSRPRDAADESAKLTTRDRAVLDHLPPDTDFDLRNPANVKSLLRRVGIEVLDTRAWRLEQLRTQHPVIDALLTWRKAERMATTFGYTWLDENVGPDQRLRGSWSASDGASGRMTATAGLHNMPADLRPSIVAEDGCLFVRSDLGQIEPRVLASVSGDGDLALATHDDDMYAPVAERLGVEREVAKVAVLGAMYGQTTGHGAEALRGLESAYPTAMGYLRNADTVAQGGHHLRTNGGRLIKMRTSDVTEMSDRDARSRAAARGRYGRNAMIQGAAAELFKMWAVLVRARSLDFGAQIVLCLHDELLVQAPADLAERTAEIVDDCLQEAAYRWAPSTSGPKVRFVTDTSVIARWSDAK
jgi:DNA polymerase-1